MRRTLAILAILILTACQPAIGSDQSATLAPSATATAEVYTTLAPTPENEATAAAMPLNCAGEMSQRAVYDYAYGEEGTGPFTPEEAFAEYQEHANTFSETPSYAHFTEDRSVWVFLNAEGRIVQKVYGELSPWGAWIIPGMEACSPLE